VQTPLAHSSPLDPQEVPEERKGRVNCEFTKEKKKRRRRRLTIGNGLIRRARRVRSSTGLGDIAASQRCSTDGSSRSEGALFVAAGRGGRVADCSSSELASYGTRREEVSWRLLGTGRGSIKVDDRVVKGSLKRRCSMVVWNGGYGRRKTRRTRGIAARARTVCSRITFLIVFDDPISALGCRRV